LNLDSGILNHLIQKCVGFLSHFSLTVSGDF